MQDNEKVKQDVNFGRSEAIIPLTGAFLVATICKSENVTNSLHLATLFDIHNLLDPLTVLNKKKRSFKKIFTLIFSC